MINADHQFDNTVSTNIAFEAMKLARKLHKSQFRKYTNNPYTDHLAEVAGIVSTIDTTVENIYVNKAVVIATAWLHDCIEDQGVTASQLSHELRLSGCCKNQVILVVHGVTLLSDMEVGNRATRKQASRDRLATAPHWVQCIKCADFISNSASIVKNDPKFTPLYLKEKHAALDVLTKAHPLLMELARVDY